MHLAINMSHRGCQTHFSVLLDEQDETCYTFITMPLNRNRTRYVRHQNASRRFGYAHPPVSRSQCEVVIGEHREPKLKAERYEPEDFVSVLERLRDHLRGLPDAAEGAVWQQVIYYLYLFIFHRRSADEQPVLADIVSETHPYLGLSDEEEQLMRSMAEVTFQEGKQEGITQGEKRGTIESILALLNMRFETDAVAALRPALEAIDDLRVLREVLLEVPESENLEAFRRTLSRNNR